MLYCAGKKREYIISRLKKENINYSYFEMVDFSSLNDLYNILDLYIVASRVEGGPARSFWKSAVV